MFDQLRQAFLRAEQLQARAQGAAAAGNTTLADGTVCRGVYGQPQVVEVPLVSGGFRRRAEVPLTLTRAQLDTPPVAQSTLTRTDITPNMAYRVEVVDTHDPFHYVLTLVRVGE